KNSLRQIPREGSAVSSENAGSATPVEGEDDAASVGDVEGRKQSAESKKDEAGGGLSSGQTEKILPYQDWRWLVLDGPVDTLWVENLNTVLDDSKVLCLASGERVALTQSVRLLFEVDSLAQASPATISRCAMVYMDPVQLGWRPFARTWAARLPKDLPESGRKHLLDLMERSVSRGLTFLREKPQHQLIRSPELGPVQTLCHLMSAMLNFMTDHGGFGAPDAVATATAGAGAAPAADVGGRGGGGAGSRAGEVTTTGGQAEAKQLYYMEKNPKELKNLLGKLFVFAFTWAFGGNLNRQEEMDIDISNLKGAGGGGAGGGGSKRPMEDVADEFDNLVHELFDTEPPLGVRLPSASRNIFGYFVDLESGNFLPWESLVPSSSSLVERATSVLGGSGGVGSSGGAVSRRSTQPELVATVDTIRYSFLTALLLVSRSPVLLVGESGVGKTALLRSLLKKLAEPNGASTQGKSVLGQVLSYSEKSAGLLESLRALTNDGDDDGSDDGAQTEKQGLEHSLLFTTFEFTAQTRPSRLQSQISGRLVKRSRDVLGPRKGRRMVIFVDDLNMPLPDEFGTQAPLELLRQFLDLGGFYDLQKLSWRSIVDTVMLAACGPSGGGRHPVSPRLLRHFSLLSLPLPSSRSLQHIYHVQLGRFLQDHDFHAEIRDLMLNMVSCAINLYYRLRAALKPTPAKLHYTYNLRDLTKVVEGFYMASEKVVTSREACIDLFVHESTRVLHDRLCTPEDRETFFAHLADELRQQLKLRLTGDALRDQTLMFARFLDPSAAETSGARGGGAGAADEAAKNAPYAPVRDLRRLRQALEDLHMKQRVQEVDGAGDEASGGGGDQQFVFFKEAMEHIVRAVRVLGQPRGHLLLIGIDGTGKTSTVRMAASIARARVARLRLTRNYQLQDFRADLKSAFIRSAVQNSGTVFLLTDADIVNESFLEDVNSILNSGDVPDLFDAEELEGVLINLKGDASSAGLQDNREELYAFFLDRVRRNLHVVLTLSPLGDRFRQRCRANPSLINCTTIDWFDPWSPEAMLSVAEVYFEQKTLLALKPEICKACVTLHQDMEGIGKRFFEETKRPYYVTPSSYMEFIKTFSKMMLECRTKLEGNRDRLTRGLRQLDESDRLVVTMQEDLVQLGPQIEAKAQETERMLADLQLDQQAVEEVRLTVVQEESVMQQEAEIVERYAFECQQDLDSVIPALQEAVRALDALSKQDISEVRVYTNPPDLVLQVMGSVCVLLGVKPDAKNPWKTSKQLLTDPHFLSRMVSLDKDAISPKVFRQLKKFTRQASFKPDQAGQVSRACQSICTWVLALEHYHDVQNMIVPKQRKVEEAKKALAIAKSNLEVKQKRLGLIVQQLAALQRDCEASVSERESLKQRLVQTGARLKRAGLLTAALGGERQRWEEAIDSLRLRLRTLSGDTLLSAGAVAYFGALTAPYRQAATQRWCDLCREKRIPLSDGFSFVGCQTTPHDLLDWQNRGLARDANSAENAVILRESRRWCLMIDPQQQGLRYLQGLEPSLKLARATDPAFLQTVERAIRVGEPVVLLDVGESLDPTLGPVLRKEIFHRGGHKLIRVGENDIDYGDGFRLYLCSATHNPHFLPAASILVNIVNFSVTFEGLQEQLLSCVVAQERPELEQERAALLQSLARDGSLLRELEDRTLGLLQGSTRHILDDEDLPRTLEQSRSMSSEISERVAKAAATERELSAARQVYLPVATRGAVIYFVIADLPSINLMYQFSLSTFESSFRRVIAAVPSKDSEDQPLSLEQRMRQMIHDVTMTTQRTVTLALFSEHRLCFAFLLCAAVMRAVDRLPAAASVGTSAEPLPQRDWNFFLHGAELASLSATASSGTAAAPTDSPIEIDWPSESVRAACASLESAPSSGFEGLCASFSQATAQWQSFRDADDAFELMLKPPNLTPHFDWSKLPDFRRLLLIRLLRPAQLEASMRHLVARQLGPEFTGTNTAGLREAFESASAETPLLFLMAPGADPTAALMRLATDLRGSALHLDMVSLGRGQGPKAEELIGKAQILKGRWVFLQNCHLAASWMPRLQQLVDSFQRGTMQLDSQFRLLLSSKPDASFPVPVLHAACKVAIETPRGVKSLLRKAFAPDGTGLVSSRGFDSQTPDTRRLVFALCLFNSVLLERSRFGSLGFNVPYEFNDSDLEVSLVHLTGKSTVDWPAVSHLVGDIAYGGRVTDERDRRCLAAVLGAFLRPEALQPGWQFATGLTSLPDEAEFNWTQAYINQLPEAEPPDVFGMDSNSERAAMEARGRRLLDVVAAAQPRIATTTAAGSATSVDSIGGADALAIEVIEHLTQLLPKSVERESLEPEDLRKRLGPRQSLAKAMALEAQRSGGGTVASGKLGSALHQLLRQEIDRYDNLLRQVRRDLKQLRLALHGDTLMTDSLESALSAFLRNRVPPAWLRYESCKSLSAWAADLRTRVRFLAGWAERLVRDFQQRSGLLKEPDMFPHGPEPFAHWLPAFFFPQGFLTAVLQAQARRLRVPVDLLEFRHRVLPSSPPIGSGSVEEFAFQSGSPTPTDGVFVFGLVLDSAAWTESAGGLTESPSGSRFCELPAMHMLPCQTGTPDPADSTDSTAVGSASFSYDCPVYRTARRAGALSSTGHSTNFVCSVRLPATQPQSVWRLRGAALLCAPDID
uniref:Dynein heavy chain n=1 Tax=Macrostomum lignano TaxID=282301 RepID=A0A1I8G1P7_9PLAT